MTPRKKYAVNWGIYGKHRVYLMDILWTIVKKYFTTLRSENQVSCTSRLFENDFFVTELATAFIGHPSCFFVK